uniref:Uncharacterized protein n=1 Tax=Panagrolaimus sp. ES5 TaxID=591445 RepID=A0AC34F2X1_9BILA
MVMVPLLKLLLYILFLEETTHAAVKTTLPKAKQQITKHRTNTNSAGYYDDISAGRSSAEEQPSNSYKFATNFHGTSKNSKQTDEQKLLYHLLRQYERAVRPVRNASHTITVKLGMTLTNIFDMDEKNQVLTINVWLDQEWKDELLRWDPAQFNGIQSLRIPCFQVDITNRSDNVDLTNYVVSGEFDLIRVHQKRRVVKYTCCPEPYPDVTFYIHIRRKTLYYMYNIIFPCLMMSVLTLLVFLLPPDSGEKISLGITVLLAFSVFVLAIAEKMPETSDSVPLIEIYLTVVMGMSSISVVMTVVVLNFHHRGPFNRPVPRWLRRVVLEKLRAFLGIQLNYNQYSSTNGAIPNSVSSNGILRRMSTRMQVDDIVLGNSMIEANKDLFQETELISIENGESVLRKKAKKLNDLHSKLLKTLEMLIKRQEVDDFSQKIAHEWRQVAQVIDRFLFWIFLILTVVITTVLLLVIPIYHRSMDEGEFDEAEYGLH